jgi:hypothetical protein
MATAVRNLTKMGTDVRKIAALLRAKAPEGHMLAYISPEEAQLLKDRGGSGKPHADTGIPSFEEVDSPAGAGGTSDEYGMPNTGGGAYLPVSEFGGLYPSGSLQGGDTTTTFTPSRQAYAGNYVPGALGSGTFDTAPIDTSIGAAQQRVLPGTTQFAPVQGTLGSGTAGILQAPAPQTFDVTKTPDETVSTFGQKPAPQKDLGDLLGSKLGVAGITGLLGALQARKAGQAGQQGAQDIQKLAAPYQQTGQQLQAQAQAGALTPTGQQSLQALQAQVAQGVQARGGVGAQQAQAAVEQLRQQLLQQQYDYGLKLSSIGDNIAMGAIKTGMQADQYANQLTSTYFNNIARIASGTPTATPQVGVNQ